MGAVTYVQSLRIIAGATPVTAGQPIFDKDFAIEPMATQTYSNVNEDDTIRYAIPDGTNNQPLCIGTVAQGSILVVTPDEDITITIVNGVVQSPLLFRGGMTSILHTSFTGLLVTNNSGMTVTGKLFVAGD